MLSAQQSLPTGAQAKAGQYVTFGRCEHNGVVPHFSSDLRLLVAREPFRLCRSLTVAACLRKTTNSRGIYFLAGNTQRPATVALRPRRARSRAELMARHGRARHRDLLVLRGCNEIEHFAGLRALVPRRASLCAGDGRRPARRGRGDECLGAQAAMPNSAPSSTRI